MRYLLDTNIISDLMKQPQGVVADRIRNAGETNIATSIIVIAELRFGIHKRGSVRLAKQLEAILTELKVEDFRPDADRQYGQLRTELERSGQPVGQNDMLIAAHALALDAVLVTDNTREFSRIAGLKVENWLRA